MISTRIVCRSFVGRSEELDHLLLRRRQAADGRGGLVLIAGEPGIGKSRLVREFKERLNRHTSIVAAAACREFAQKPLGALLDVLQQAAHVGPDAFAGSSKSDRLERIAGTFERLAAKRTTVAIVEDLHWADVDLVATLLLLVQRAAKQRLLFVATYRQNEVVATHPLFKWFGSLLREPNVSLVTLTRFANRELDRLMALATEGIAELKAPVLHAVRARSDGNPLFAEELLRAAVDARRAGLQADASALPISLHAIVAERLKQCSDDERTLLRSASLLGRNFDVALLSDIFGGTAATMQPLLERTSDLQLIDAVDDAGGRYRFRHALTRDAVYAEIPRATLEPLHLRIAERLEQRPNAVSLPEDLAHHFWRAGHYARAAAYYEAAGEAAMAAFAYDDAAVAYQRAAEGYDGDAASQARVRARAARALIFAGDLDAGLALYERAVELALQLGNAGEAVRCRAIMAGHLFDAGRRDAAIALLRDSLATARRDAALHARLQTRLAMTLARDSRPNEAWETLQAIDVSSFDDAGEAAAEYYLGASELHAVRGEPAQWQAAFARGIAIYEARGHPGPLQVAHTNFAVQALSTGHTDLAREHHRVAAELAQRLHFDDQPIFLAQLELYAGNLAQARCIVEAMPRSNRFLIRAMLAQVAVPLAVALGDDAMLVRYLDETLLAGAGDGLLRETTIRIAAALALGLAAADRHAEARALLERVQASLTSTFGMAFPIVALVTLLPNNARAIRPLLETAAAPEGDRVNKALLALVDRHYDAAAEGFAAIGWPLFEAQCRALAGDVKRALAIYRRCGAAGELRRLEFGERASAQASPLGALTPRERELALQVASGKANRAVADALSIGEKTVEKYLTSIYAKLGLHSRAQLAALVASSQRRG